MSKNDSKRSCLLKAKLSESEKKELKKLSSFEFLQKIEATNPLLWCKAWIRLDHEMKPLDLF